MTGISEKSATVSNADVEGGLAWQARVPETCVGRAVSRWLNEAEITRGPILTGILPDASLRENELSGRSIAQVVKRVETAAGLDLDRFGGHSHQGWIPAVAARRDVNMHLIARQTRHRCARSLQTYEREGTLFRENASGRLGL